MEALVQKLCVWMEDKVTEAKAQGIVFGLSGGLDSAVVAALSIRIFPQNTLAIIIPCHSLQADIDDALGFVDKFNIPYKIIDVSKVYDSFIHLLNDEEKEGSFKLAEANIKPRLRMTTLYYFANKLNYLVVGTGNKSELMIGYFTKYGDGGADILPLGNLVKSQVRELAEYLGIPKKIINKPPSAGLWEGQTDEKEIGISYEQLDKYLKIGKLNNKIIEKKIQDKITKSAHKRTTPAKPPF
ncbi:MAG: NAD(+) synthase [Candidatus Caldatribacteriota bacterium]|nr:NAD(+) synthase [Candidatus Caldatribacteriota bacterium]